MAVGEGTRVYLNFSLSLEDGSEVDSNFGGDAVDFVVGDGRLPEGFERRLYGMVAGERQMFSVPPADAFGEPNEHNVQQLPRGQFEEGTRLEKGLVHYFADAAGGEVAGVITEFDEQRVVVDFNHPLAGRTLLFDAHIHRVEPAELH